MRGRKKTDQEFQRELKMKRTGIHTDEKYITATTKLLFYCDYNHFWYTTPTCILDSKTGCPYCAGQKPIIGETDLWTTRPDIASALENKDDGFKCKEYSHKKLSFICPNCKTKFKQDLNHVCKRGLSCPVCSDGISYPNKFMRSVLFQLKVDHIAEYRPKWISPKRYDFYFCLNNKLYIVEMDGGLGHGNEIKGCTWFDKDKSIKVDDYKDKMAMEHGIEVIRINCNYNREILPDKIRDNLIASKLNNILDFSTVDFRKCDLDAQKSIFYKICSMWNEETHSVHDIANRLNISLDYVKRQLRRARKLSLVNSSQTDNVAHCAE